MAFLRQRSGLNNGVHLPGWGGEDSSNKLVMKWEQLEPWRCVWIQTLSKGPWALLKLVLQLAWLAGGSAQAADDRGQSQYCHSEMAWGGIGTAALEKTLIYSPSDMRIKRWKAFRVQQPCLWGAFTNAPWKLFQRSGTARCSGTVGCSHSRDHLLSNSFNSGKKERRFSAL